MREAYKVLVWVGLFPCHTINLTHMNPQRKLQVVSIISNHLHEHKDLFHHTLYSGLPLNYSKPSTSYVILLIHIPEQILLSVQTNMIP